jgi:predicted nucleic acid-binding protein
MQSPAPAQASPRVVADASSVISLLASGSFREIAQALRVPISVVSVVTQELERGRARWNSYDHLAEMVSAGIVTIVGLDEAAMHHFEALVVGSALETLDDGEAATIAYALTTGAEAIIDERKAWRICGERYPNLVIRTTVDLLLSPSTEALLGSAGVADALFRALDAGRMRVPPAHLQRVARLVGSERAALCRSIPLHVRPRPR